MISTDF